jgi:hypothetical protein
MSPEDQAAYIKRGVAMVLANIKPQLDELRAMVREIAETQRLVSEAKLASLEELKAANLALVRLLATVRIQETFDPSKPINQKPSGSIQ